MVKLTTTKTCKWKSNSKELKILANRQNNLYDEQYSRQKSMLECKNFIRLDNSISISIVCCIIIT